MGRDRSSEDDGGKRHKQSGKRVSRRHPRRVPGSDDGLHGISDMLQWLPWPKWLPWSRWRSRSKLCRWLDVGAGIFLSMFLLSLVMNGIEPFGLDQASKARSEKITARLMAPFYQSRAQDDIAVVLIDDQTLESREMGWPPEYLYYEELLRRVLAHQPRAVYLDVLLQQRRSYDPSFEEARDGIDRLVRESGIPVFFGVSEPGRKSLFSSKEGVQDVVTGWQGAGSDYPLRLEARHVYGARPGATQAYRDDMADGADTRTVALVLYQAVCSGDNQRGCPTGTNQLQTGDLSSPMYVHWGSSYPKLVDAWPSRTPSCVRQTTPTYRERVMSSWNLLKDSWSSGRDSGREDENRPLCPYTLTIAEQWLDDGDLLDSRVLEDRIVLIGTRLTGIDDRVESPVHQSIPGVYLHAMALDNLMEWGHRRLHRNQDVAWMGSLVLGILLSFAAAGMLMLARGALLRLFLLLLITGVICAGMVMVLQVCLRQPPQDWIGKLLLLVVVVSVLVIEPWWAAWRARRVSHLNRSSREPS